MYISYIFYLIIISLCLSEQILTLRKNIFNKHYLLIFMKIVEIYGNL